MTSLIKLLARVFSVLSVAVLVMKNVALKMCIYLMEANQDMPLHP